MLEKAISAISCIFLGKMDRNDNLLRHGLGLYNNAIKHMSTTLKRKAYSEDVLYTSMIFQELEVKSCTCRSTELSLLTFHKAIHCPQNLEGYVMHLTGVRSILEQYPTQVLANPRTAAIYHKDHKLKVVRLNSCSIDGPRCAQTDTILVHNYLHAYVRGGL